MTAASLKFEPFVTSVSVSFWTTLKQRKLDDLKLSDTPVPISGYWVEPKAPRGAPPRFHLDERSFETGNRAAGEHWERGLLVLYNTENEFKSADKQQFLLQCRKSSPFMVMFVFADLKRYLFKYYMAFPCLVSKDDIICSSLGECIIANDELMHDAVSREFALPNQIVFSWPTRHCLSRLQEQGVKSFDIVTLRFGKNYKLSLEAPSPQSLTWIPGWEREQNSDKPALRIVDLAPLMDPMVLAKESSDLNLKLMKWRLVPELDLERLQSTKCLLFGAGTLGCNGWGIRNVTVVDCGRCSFSNPVRQSLVTFADCGSGGEYKALALAKNAKLVDPNCNVTGHVLRIPMPGHRPEPDWLETVQKLSEMIAEHDVLFLLTDSRESRWLPTLLGALNNKLVLTVALGFDSFVVMKQGPSCYFCADIVSPTDSITNRTLDQQCTVSRPGVSMQASALGVELMVSVLAGRNVPGMNAAPPPQQLRGSLHDFTVTKFHGPASPYCSACSESVLSEAKRDLTSFLDRVFTSPDYLDRVSGVSTITTAMETTDLEAVEDDF